MATTYEKLIAAGAPAIVEPRLYRIHEDYRNGELIVELRERLPYKGTRLLQTRRVDPRAATDVLSEVVSALAEAVEAQALSEAKTAVIGEFGPA
ncbi:hypothetical protein SEA_BAILEYBLU_45 [Arthrobacter phage BaileyBlu]|uniref:Uncharacterized protein n=1 Tax=Arthrobacter phage BaileyBlu TaxID=2910754 RepID=A0AA49BPN9_9CAUD|nr:hypothetical protein PQD78_gp45 [Arthrobacter phage BaileyBlu]UJQ87183.1 hypothetical protein SEA_BAILEYBLU_45 [Arthrobacter phage BaileyBlu]